MVPDYRFEIRDSRFEIDLESRISNLEYQLILEASVLFCKTGTVEFGRCGGKSAWESSP